MPTETETTLRSFTDLNAWKQGHQLVLGIYQATSNFPSTENFGLTSQIRRCAVSITSNIAEGFSRNTKKEKDQFYSIALGSLTELQNQLIIAKDVGYISPGLFQQIAHQTIETKKLVHGLMKSSKSKPY